MDIKECIEAVFKEIRRAEELHLGWPVDFCEALTIITEEHGELAHAIIENKYRDGPLEDIKEEAIHLAAMSLRFVFAMSDASVVQSEEQVTRNHRVGGSNPLAGSNNERGCGSCAHGSEDDSDYDNCDACKDGNNWSKK